MRRTRSATSRAASRSCSSRSAATPTTCAPWPRSCRTNSTRHWRSSSRRWTTSNMPCRSVRRCRTRPCLTWRAPAMAWRGWARWFARCESSRMERSIEAAEPEDVDLRDVVRGCAEAYRPLIGTRRLTCELPATALYLHGAPELIAQALDKLLDNALSFTPPDGWLRLSLSAATDGAEIELANQGPTLPAAMQGRLFDSLVSLRDKATPGDVPHLGLGLYVVRLVAERHGGIASARNLDDGSGVAFSLRLRGMPRQRLGG